MAGIGEANQTCHEYGKDMEVVRAAGMMIFRRTTAKDPMEYLMMRASYGKKHWTPPKVGQLCLIVFLKCLEGLFSE